jgi:protocatechuate 3,4-dioxygenase, beta subunit
MQAVQWTRRQATGYAAAVGVAAVWGSARAQNAPALRLTPSQTEGPYYPDKIPQDTDFDLLRNGASQYTRGQATWLTGKVSDIHGKPVAGAVVEIWQCDNDGHYHHSADGGRADPAFQGFGKVQVGADGSYRFRTLRPAQYSGRTPHIHMKVKLANRDVLTTQLYVANDPGNERDGLWRRMSNDARAALTVPFVQGSDGLQAQFGIVVAV